MFGTAKVGGMKELGPLKPLQSLNRLAGALGRAKADGANSWGSRPQTQ